MTVPHMGDTRGGSLLGWWLRDLERAIFSPWKGWACSLLAASNFLNRVDSLPRMSEGTERSSPWSNKAIRPVLAHPERNAVIQRDPSLVREFVEAGAVLQLTAMSIEGENGKRALSAATWILEEGIAGLVSSDSHSPTWRPPTLRGSYRLLVERFGQETAYRLCATHPAAVAEGRYITIPGFTSRRLSHESNLAANLTRDMNP